MHVQCVCDVVQRGSGETSMNDRIDFQTCPFSCLLLERLLLLLLFQSLSHLHHSCGLMEGRREGGEGGGREGEWGRREGREGRGRGE